MADKSRPGALATGIHRFNVEDESPVGDGNRHTGVTRRPEIPLHDPLPLRALFRARLDQIRRAYQGTPQHGACIIAVDPRRGVAGSLTLAAPESGAPAFATVGRHERCQLRLTDPALSLRHALITLRRLPNGDVRLRMLDLRSGLGLVGEDGRSLESVSVEGHLFVGMGRYVLMVMLGGEDLGFSEDGEQVFDALPPRVFFDARERLAPVESRVAPAPFPRRGKHDSAPSTGTGHKPPERGDSTSRVDILRRPEPLGSHAGPLDTGKAGTLTIRCDAGSATVPLYDAQVRDGVLLGRYDRCESADLPFELPDTVSRVHALILMEGGGLYVMDTASTFGMHTGETGDVAMVRLDAASSLHLGADTLVEWHPAPADGRKALAG